MQTPNETQTNLSSCGLPATTESCTSNKNIPRRGHFDPTETYSSDRIRKHLVETLRDSAPKVKMQKVCLPLYTKLDSVLTLELGPSWETKVLHAKNHVFGIADILRKLELRVNEVMTTMYVVQRGMPWQCALGIIIKQPQCSQFGRTTG